MPNPKLGMEGRIGSTHRNKQADVRELAPGVETFFRCSLGRCCRGQALPHVLTKPDITCWNPWHGSGFRANEHNEPYPES